MVTHSEAIAALAGGETEHQLLDKRFDEFTGMTRTINRALVPFNAYQKLFCACSNGRLGLWLLPGSDGRPLLHAQITTAWA